MDIRTFRASTLQEALEQVRETLGPDAAVLHTREVKRSRLGFFSSSLIEVEASIELPANSRLSRPIASAHQPPPSRVAAIHSAIAARTADSAIDSEGLSAHAFEDDLHVKATDNPKVHGVAGTVALTGSKPRPAANRGERMAGALAGQDVDEALAVNVRSKSRRVSADAESGATLSNEPFDDQKNDSRARSTAVIDGLTTMLDAGVDPVVAKSLMRAAVENLTSEQMNDALLLQGRICQLVGKSLRIAEPIMVKQNEQVVVAMVGSAGVGKTTTLAKIAKTVQIDQSCEVGLLTMDIFRPGAVDQLLQYAESLDATLEVVSAANQFLPALQRLKHCDIIFIDTAGRSPNDLEQIQVLQEILDAAQPTSVQLVVSATSSTSHIRAAVQQFSPLHPTGLVITKLDEAIDFGSWLDVLQQIELPVSYIGYGQHVPQDIMPANRRRLANFLLGHAAQLPTAD